MARCMRPRRAGGWIAFSNSAQGYAFAERFTYFPEAEYPDQGATVECWTVGRGKVANLDYENSQIYLMETEVLSPFYTFQPGETHSCRIEWGACRAAGRIMEVHRAGCVHQPLAVEAVQGEVQPHRLLWCVRCRAIAADLERPAWKTPGSISLAKSARWKWSIWQTSSSPLRGSSLELSLADADGSRHLWDNASCHTLGDDHCGNPRGNVETRQIAYLRPDQIVQEIERCPLAYLPVGPLEWHGPHLPLGVDALNARKRANARSRKDRRPRLADVLLGHRA